MDQLMSFLSLPEDLFLEVLTRLPVNSLGRCKSVAKSWNDLISSREFLKFHVNQSPNKMPPMLIVSKTVTGGSKEIYLVELSIGSHSVVTENQRLHNPFESSGRKLRTRIVGTCNGLICQIHWPCNVHLWTDNEYRKLDISLCNPLMKCSWGVPKSPEVVNDEQRCKGVSWYGFGYDDVHDDYKVMITRGVYKYKYKHEVYSLRANAWYNVSSYLSSRYHSVGDIAGVFVSSVLHWGLIISRPASRDDDGKRIEKNSILAFDLRTNQHKVLPVPKVLEDIFPLSLSVLNGCLVLSNVKGSLFKSNESPFVFHLWVMKDYGLKDSWTKVTIRSSPGMCRLPPVVLLDDNKNNCLKGKLVFYDSYYGTVSLYDLSNGQVVEYSTPGGFHSAKPYQFVGSLVQPRPPGVH